MSGYEILNLLRILREATHEIGALDVPSDTPITERGAKE